MKKIMAMKDAQIKKNIKTWSRKSEIFPEFIGLTFDVYNGKEFIPVFVTDDIVGHNWA
jgi:small subunit ribosomal protein S19